MVTVHQRCERREVVDGELTLPLELRQRSRFRAHLVSGEEVAISLERGSLLRDGDCVLAEDGRVLRVTAQPERLLEVRCASPGDLVLAAYHLGNRHVPVAIGDGWLRIAADDVLRDMLERLGATTEERELPFEPESGAYVRGPHRHSESSKPPAIHHFGDPPPHAH